MSNTVKCPCYLCDSRTVNCHSTCEDYNKFTQERSKREKEREREQVYQDYLATRIARSQKRAQHNKRSPKRHSSYEN